MYQFYMRATHLLYKCAFVGILGTKIKKFDSNRIIESTTALNNIHIKLLKSLENFFKNEHKALSFCIATLSHEELMKLDHL